MQKLHKSKTPKVYKNKKLNNANFGTYNLNDYQVFLQLVSKLGKIDINGTYKQSQALERKHLLTAKEFSEAFNVDINTTYRVLKTASKKLARTAITLEKPDLFVTQEIPICSFAEYNNKEGSLTIEFNEHIMPYLAQVKEKFVLYNLKEIANFGSLYSTRLYELIQEFKDTGWIEKSVSQLREIFAVGKKYATYKDFKVKTFAHAVDEINSQYPTMNLRFNELKDGRKVVLVRFEFTPSHKEQGYNPATKQFVNVTVKPKQIPPIRKSKHDDDNTPPPVHPDQQELNFNTKNNQNTLLKKVAHKVVNSKYAEKNFAPSLKKLTKKISEDKITKEDLKEYTTERKNEIKRDIAQELARLEKMFSYYVDNDRLEEADKIFQEISLLKR